MSVIAYPGRDALAEGLAAAVAEGLRAAIAEKGAASLGLPGGTTPAPFMEALSRQPLDWTRVTVFPADERWVPDDSPRSNAGLIRAHLLQGPADRARLIGLYDPAFDSPEAGAPAAAGRLAGVLPPDVLVLGMGNDMHTASLFPGAPQLPRALDPDAPPVMAMTGPAPDHEPRLSLTLPALRAAGARHLLLTGADKRETLDRALALEPGTDFAAAPILALLPGMTVHWAP